MKHTNRRDFLKTSSMLLIAAPVMGSLTALSNVSAARSISGTPFKGLLHKNQSLVLSIKDFGAIGDGVIKDTTAIQDTIDRCHVLGGGEVLIPAGIYFTGAIKLLSNVVLRLEKDSVILGSPDFADYPVAQVRWEGKWIKGYRALIYAVDSENIGIKGPGKVAGNHSLGGRPNAENPLRHPALIEPINCRNLTFEDFSTDYYRMWCIHPTYCENLEFKNLYIRSSGGNGDGIDIDSCRNVFIDGCDIETGDDCIAIKSGRGMEANKLMRITENVHISNCRLSDKIYACIGIGSETSGGVRNVTIENCSFHDTKTHAIYIKSRPGRGAFIENISADNLDVSGMEGGFLRFNILGSGLQDQIPVPGLDGIPSISNFSFSNIRVNNINALFDGTSIHPDKPLKGLVFKNVTGECKKGILLANIIDAQISNINVSGFEGPLIGIYNVKGKGLEKAEIIEFPHKVEPMINAPEPPYVLK